MGENNAPKIFFFLLQIFWMQACIFTLYKLLSHILKKCYFSDEQALNLLVDALAEILSKLNTDKFVVVGLEDEFSDQLCKYSKSSPQAGGLEPCVSSQAEEYDCTSFLSEESFHAKIRLVFLFSDV